METGGLLGRRRHPGRITVRTCEAAIRNIVIRADTEVISFRIRPGEQTGRQEEEEEHLNTAEIPPDQSYLPLARLAYWPVELPTKLERQKG